MDSNNYDYVSLGMPNLLAELPKGNPEGITVQVTSPKLLALVTRVAKCFPSWKIVAQNLTWIDIGKRIKGARLFNVWLDTELLGSIGMDYIGARTCYTVNNDRVTAAMSRSGPRKTENPDKAFKMVKENFVPKSASEIIVDRFKFVAQTLYQLDAGVSRSLTPMGNTVDKIAKDWIDENWDAFVDYACKKLGCDVGTLATYRETRDKLKEIRMARSDFNDGLWVVVVTRGDEYLVADPLGKSSSINHIPTVHTTDTLPQNYKRLIGMLKLIDVEGFIPGVGARITRDTYYLINKENK